MQVCAGYHSWCNFGKYLYIGQDMKIIPSSNSNKKWAKWLSPAYYPKKLYDVV